MVKFISRGIIALAIVLGAANAGEAFAAAVNPSTHHSSGSWRAWPARVVGGGRTGVQNYNYARGLTVNGHMNVFGPSGGSCSFNDSTSTAHGEAYDECSVWDANGLHTAAVSASHTWSNPNEVKNTNSTVNHP
ncbi:hypothetical protein [Herpetosiphon giganteus]|uniref:hypothetical protein n=1 Tax=Herpetosiphon giganteus TaxID=2029754 RepID=UPI00195D362A|nr:hypothetical protein [Herpetosiphon giganteus]MBM7843071.1 hypothetical protein [Herpetosiphon giganteus]